MRVLHLVKTSVGATWALRQMRELVKLGVEIHVAVPPGGPLVAEYGQVGVEVHPLQFDFPLSQPLRVPSVLGAFRSLVEKVHPDIIHSHFVGTTLTMRIALGKAHPIPRLFQVPGPLHLEHSLFRWGELLTAGPPDYWIGSCRWTCERYRGSGVSEDRIFLSYYGLDQSRFVHQKTGQLRKELGLGVDTRIVGMVAYMYAPKWYLGQKRGLKGHEDLIDALAICFSTMRNIVGVFVGGAWNNAIQYEMKVRAYGEKHCGERLVFLGTRSEVPELYPDFDVVVHPSHSENVGGAAESLLLGVPTIVTNVGGFPDLIVPGETGWIVPSRNPTVLAEVILSVLRDCERRGQIARRGQTLARSLFDIGKTARDVLNIYEKVLATQTVT